MDKKISSQKKVYDSAKRAHPAWEELKGVLRYKDLIIQLIRRDLVSRYKRSILGIGWTLMNPLGTMLIMTIVFSRVFSQVKSYPVFVLSGLIVWNFFSQTTQHCMSSTLWGSGLFKSIYLPRTSFIISSIGTGIVNFGFSLIPLLIIMLFTKTPIHLSVLMLPVNLLLLSFFALGVGLLLSAYSVFFPDIAEMYTIILMAWMYLSPVIIPEATIGSIMNGLLLKINPLYYLIKLFRVSIYDGMFPSISLVLSAGGISLAMFTIGWFVFTKKSDQFSYYV